jgi:hypothetical protein
MRAGLQSDARDRRICFTSYPKVQPLRIPRGV